MVGQITNESVWRAIDRARRDGVPPNRMARTAFVVDDTHGDVFPAKYIFGLAHEIAAGEGVAPANYTSERRCWDRLEQAGLRFVRERPQRMCIVTVAVEGPTSSTLKENIARSLLMARVCDEISSRGWRPAAVVFPGGYFYLPGHVGPEPHEARCRLVDTQSFSRDAAALATNLEALIVAGVDGEPWLREDVEDWEERDFGDQLCAAWSSSGLVGLGRKVFPTNERTVDSGEAAGYVTYEDDLTSPGRTPEIREGLTALLCACYDMFGCAERPEAQGTRASQIRWLGSGFDGIRYRAHERAEFRHRLGELLRGWRGLVDSASVGFAAVHYFSLRGPGSGIDYWERHGVQKASTQVGGRLAFAAYHREALPAPHVGVLAAANGTRLPVRDHFYTDGPDLPRALVRRFEVLA
jgi:hypothetical protein